MQGQVNADRWAKLRDRLKDGARLPLMVLVMFASGVFAWLGGWTLWRTASYVFERWLSHPWRP